MSGSEKKVNRNTYNIFPIKRVTRKFLEVCSVFVVVQNNGKEIYEKSKKKSCFWLVRKKVCCTCQGFFFGN